MYPWVINPNNALLQGKFLKITIPLHVFDPPKMANSMTPVYFHPFSQKLPSQHPSPRIATKAPRRAACSCRTSVRACATALLSPPLFLVSVEAGTAFELAMVNCLSFIQETVLYHYVIYGTSKWCRWKYR